jgi:hypothetical protein
VVHDKLQLPSAANNPATIFATKFSCRATCSARKRYSQQLNRSYVTYDTRARYGSISKACCYTADMHTSKHAPYMPLCSAMPDAALQCFLLQLACHRLALPHLRQSSDDSAHATSHHQLCATPVEQCRELHLPALLNKCTTTCMRSSKRILHATKASCLGSNPPQIAVMPLTTPHRQVLLSQPTQARRLLDAQRHRWHSCAYMHRDDSSP